MSVRGIGRWALMAAALFTAGPTLAAQPQIAPLPSAWMAAARTGCKVWNPQPERGETVTWTGACVGGFASGPGVTQWIEDGVPGERTEGARVAGHLQGRGVQFFENGDRFDGEWKDDRKSGQGTYKAANGLTYVGGFKDDVFDGMGTLDDGAGYRYVGEWKAGRRNGVGTATFKDGSRYVGRWVDDKPVDPVTGA